MARSRGSRRARRHARARPERPPLVDFDHDWLDTRSTGSPSPSGGTPVADAVLSWEPGGAVGFAQRPAAFTAARGSAALAETYIKDEAPATPRRWLRVAPTGI